MFLIVNEALSDNLGDQLISRAASSIFRDCFTADYSWFVSSSGGDRSERALQSEKKVKRQSFIKLFLGKGFLAVKFWRKYRRLRFEAVVVGGGQLLLSNRVFPVNLFLWSLLAAVWNIPFYVLSVGLSADTSYIQKSLIQISLKRARLVTVRDRESKYLLQSEYGISAEVMPDLVYIYSTGFYEDKRMPRSFVCPVEYNVYLNYIHEADFIVETYEEYIDFWSDLVLEESRKGEVAIGATTRGDTNIAKRIAQLTNSHFIECETHNEFRSEVRKCTRVIGGRMHALIMAHIEGVEAVPISLSRKLISFSDEYLIERDALVIRNRLISQLESIFEKNLFSNN